MATRKSGDGSRGADEAGVSPGSYAKVSGSRRKRKKKGRSMPPSAPPPGSTALLVSGRDDLEDVVDTEGVDTSEEVGRQTQPDWGTATRDERDMPVDDLRRKPTSSRAPKKPHGPLGMDEPVGEGQLQPDAVRRISSPVPPSSAGSAAGRMRVIEINPPESANNNTRWGDEDEAEASDDEGGEQDSDEFELDTSASGTREGYNPLDDADDDVAPASALGAAREADNQNEREADRNEREPDHADEREDEDELSRILDERLRDSHAPRHSLSSVLGARPSMRPSPPPPPEKLSPIWWLMVTLLSAIIIAAGIIAYREATQKPEQVVESTPVRDTTPPAPKASTQSPYDVRNPPSSNGQNSATITSAPSGFAAPTPKAAPERTVLRSPPEEKAAPGAKTVGAVPAAQKAPPAKASASPAPSTPAPTATTTAPAVRPAPVRAQAPAVKPAVRPRPAPAAAAPATPPGAPPASDVERPIGAASQPEPAPPAPEPAPAPRPVDEVRLPINPYAE